MGGAGPVSATTAWLWPPSASWAQTGLPPDVGGFGCGMGPCGESSPTGDSLEDVHAANELPSALFGAPDLNEGAL